MLTKIIQKIQNRRVFGNLIKKDVIKNLKNYWKRYESVVNPVEPIKIKDHVYYIDPTIDRSKLTAEWTGEGVVIGKRYKSYEILKENGKSYVLNERYVKKIFNGSNFLMGRNVVGYIVGFVSKHN